MLGHLCHGNLALLRGDSRTSKVPEGKHQARNRDAHHDPAPASKPHVRHLYSFRRCCPYYCRKIPACQSLCNAACREAGLAEIAFLVGEGDGVTQWARPPFAGHEPVVPRPCVVLYFLWYSNFVHVLSFRQVPTLLDFPALCQVCPRSAEFGHVWGRRFQDQS